MSIINKPDDVLSLALKNLINPLLEDEKFVKKIKNLKYRVIVLELEDIYGITLTFNNGTILIEYGEKPKYHLKIIITLDAFVGIAERKVSLVGAFLRRKARVKKIYRIFTILKFYRILFPAIKKASEEPILEGVINVL
ncbi:MAG: SCP2 sterol-binding domain-containing protein [Promethearchaeota archaeon]